MAPGRATGGDEESGQAREPQASGGTQLRTVFQFLAPHEILAVICLTEPHEVHGASYGVSPRAGSVHRAHTRGGERDENFFGSRRFFAMLGPAAERSFVERVMLHARLLL